MSLILIVEDEPQILIFAESILKEEGHDTISASNYEGAIALLNEGHKPDLALLDYNIGGAAAASTLQTRPASASRTSR